MILNLWSSTQNSLTLIFPEWFITAFWQPKAENSWSEWDEQQIVCLKVIFGTWSHYKRKQKTSNRRRQRRSSLSDFENSRLVRITRNTTHQIDLITTKSSRIYWVLITTKSSRIYWVLITTKSSRIYWVLILRFSTLNCISPWSYFMTTSRDA